MSRQLDIVVRSESSDPKQYRFRKKTVTVGRGCDVDLSISGDPRISRCHLILRPKGKNKFELLDRSRAGTFHNGNPVQRGVFSYGTIFLLGRTELQVGMPREKTTPRSIQRRVWMNSAAGKVVGYVLVIVFAIVLLAMAMRGNRDGGQRAGGTDVLPRELINTGQLDKARETLNELINTGNASVEEEELYYFVLELKDKWQTAKNTERRMDLGGARDQWQMIVYTLPNEWAELGVWIESNHINRLAKRISNDGNQ